MKKSQCNFSYGCFRTGDLPGIKPLLIIFLLLLQAIDVLAQDSRKNLVSIAFYNKYGFVVYNNTRFPLTFIFKGMSYRMEVDQVERVDIFAPLKGEENFRKIINRPQQLVVETTGKRLTKKDSYRVVFGDEDKLWQGIKLIAAELKIDRERLKYLLSVPENKRGEELKTFGEQLKKMGITILLADKFVERLNELYHAYNNAPYTQNLFKGAYKKQYRAYNPLVSIDFGNHRGFKISNNWTTNEAYFYKLSLGLFPEISLSRDRLKSSRFYLTGFYQTNWHGLQTDSAVYVGKDILTGAITDKEALGETKTNKISLTNEVLGFGLKFNTQLTPVFFTFIEGGIIKKLSDYRLKIREGYKFSGSGINFTKNEYEPALTTAKDTYPYATLALGATGLGRPLVENSTRRGLTFTVSGTAYNPGTFITQSPYQLYTQSGAPLPIEHDKSGKIQFSWSVNFGITF